MKPWVEHFCFWRSFGNEAKFATIAIIPLFIAIFLPIAYPLFMSLTYANQSVVERSAVILDADNSAHSRDMTLSIHATQGLNIKRRVDTIDEGVHAVMSREADVFVFFPEDFSAKIKRLERGDMKVYVYATNMMIYAAALTALQETVLAKNVDIAIEQIANPKGVVGDKAANVIDPIQYHKNILFSPTLAYSTYITPLLFCLVFHQMGILILGFSIGFHVERDEVFARKKLWLLDYFWRYLFYAFFIAIGTAFVYVVLSPIFAWRHGDVPLDMMKLIWLMVACNFPIAASLASFCRTRYTAFQIILGSTLIFFTLSGYVWPRYAMPEWLQPATDLLAITPVAQGIIKIAFKGATLADCGNEIDHLVRLFTLYLGLSLVVIHRDFFARPFAWIWRKIRPHGDKTITPTSPTPPDSPSAIPAKR